METSVFILVTTLVVTRWAFLKYINKKSRNCFKQFYKTDTFCRNGASRRMAWLSITISVWLCRCTPRARRCWCRSATAARTRSGGTWRAVWYATPESPCAWTRDITRSVASRRRSATRTRRRRGGISTITITSWYGCGEHAIHPRTLSYRYVPRRDHRITRSTTSEVRYLIRDWLHWQARERIYRFMRVTYRRPMYLRDRGFSRVLCSKRSSR